MEKETKNTYDNDSSKRIRRKNKKQNEKKKEICHIIIFAFSN
jgi:hypothetical protein